MTWLEGPTRNPEAAGDRLRKLLDRPEILGVPGAHNAMAGLIAREAGFEALYISGGGVTASFGIPDIGLLTLEELCFVVKMVSRATDLPLVVDGDVGYGSTLNAMRTVRELEGAGAAAVHIEDQLLPKKCGHLNDKRLVPAEEAAAKIAAAKKASTHLMIIARTDAAPVEGIDGAIKRSQLYHEAGADMAFADALASADDLRRYAEEVPGRKMVNMTEFGRTPHFTAAEFQEMGYDLVIWPATSVRVEGKALENLYAHIAREGGTKAFEDRMITRQRMYELIGYHDFEALDSTVARTIVPLSTGEAAE